ncbi:MAG: DNA-processing protein DprA [bacterium]
MNQTLEIKSTEKGFPQSLLPLSGCPRSIFLRGDPTVVDRRPNVAVVGTRRMTTYGETVIRRFVPAWSRAGLCIVSGLALGTDAAAHQAALEAGGLTLAVLGSGVDSASVTPRTNSRLAERIVSSGGALISEYPDGAPVQAYHFPARNRIVAGLSRAVVVIEAPLKSGALITARFALEYGLEVFAVPGPITVDTSRGCNWLISQGAHPLLEADDLLLALGLGTAPTAARTSASDHPLLKLIRHSPATPDELMFRSGLDAKHLMVALSELEVAGLVSRTGDRYAATD